MKEKTVVVIATYNEIENLPRLIDELRQRQPEMDILVIDDSSPDGTGDWVTTRQHEDAGLHLISRVGKLGLGSATVAGLTWALERRYQVVATMDSDFSHHPSDLDRLLECLEKSRDVDVVIGSRYVPGGGVEGWPWFRKFTSRVTNAFARLRLGLTTRDNTGAFRVYRSHVLESIQLTELHTGYAYLPELMWRMKLAGMRLKELPIVFRDRVEGRSKTSLRIGLAVYWHLLMLPFQTRQA